MRTASDNGGIQWVLCILHPTYAPVAGHVPGCQTCRRAYLQLALETTNAVLVARALVEERGA